MTRAMFLAHTAAPSGAELATMRLLTALRDTESPVAVQPLMVCTEDGPIVALMRARGIPVLVQPSGFDSRSLTIAGANPRRLLAGGLHLVRLGWALGATARAARSDVLVAESTKALVMGAVAARRARIPLVWQVHDRVTADYFGGLLALVVRWFGWAVCHGVIANSHATMSSLITWRRPAVVAYPGVEYPAAPRVSVAKRISPEPAVVMVGRLTRWKGQDILLRALAEVGTRPGRILLIGGTLFGEEDFRAELDTLAAGLGLPVEFTGHLDDPAEFLNYADILVHCSVLPEPFGQVIVEGMQAGCAVIATRAGGPAEIVTHDRDGLLVTAGDIGELSTALESLLTDRALRTRLAQAGQHRARDFDVAESARRVAALLGAITTRRGPR